jgi:hypothetical protein
MEEPEPKPIPMAALKPLAGRRLRSAVLPLGLTLAVVACFLGKKESPAAAPRSEDVPVLIVNHHWLDVTIYVIHDGQRTRLGVAGGTAETQMMLPSRLLGVGRDIQLYGDPIGSSERALTEVIVVQPGQFVEWLLEPTLDRSTVGVY